MSDDEVAEGWVPSACTLPTAEQPIRVAEFDGLFRSALCGLDRPDQTRLVLILERAPGRAENVRDLARRETECCSFFTITVAGQDRLLLLEVVVPPTHVDVLDAVAERAARVSGLAP